MQGSSSSSNVQSSRIKIRGIKLTVSHAVQNFARSFKEACEQRQYSVQGIEEVVGATLTVTATQQEPIRSMICLFLQLLDDYDLRNGANSNTDPLPAVGKSQ